MKLRRAVLDHGVVGLFSQGRIHRDDEVGLGAGVLVGHDIGRIRALQRLHIIESQICAGAGNHARGQLAALTPIVAAIALERSARRLVIAGRAVRASGDAGLAADANGVVLNHRTIFQLAVGPYRAVRHTGRLFAMVTGHREVSKSSRIILTNCRHMPQQHTLIQLLLALAGDGAGLAAVAVLIVHPKSDSHGLTPPSSRQRESDCSSGYHRESSTYRWSHNWTSRPAAPTSRSAALLPQA